MTRDTSEYDKARYEMWERLISGYSSLSRSEKVKVKYKYAESLGKKHPGEVKTGTTMDAKMKKSFLTGSLVTVSQDYFDWPAGLTGTVIKPCPEIPLIKFSPKDADGRGHNGFCGRDSTDRNCWYIDEKYLTLGCCESTPQKKLKTKEKEQDMYTTLNVQAVAPVDTTERGQRDHLYNRLWAEFHQKDKEYRQVFWLEDMDTPTTAAEAVQRIKDGLFELPGDDDFDSGYDSIRWRDPSKKADRAGYKAVLEKLKAAMKDAEDEIAIYDPEKGLETLRRFRDQTFV